MSKPTPKSKTKQGAKIAEIDPYLAKSGFEDAVPEPDFDSFWSPESAKTERLQSLPMEIESLKNWSGTVAFPSKECLLAAKMKTLELYKAGELQPEMGKAWLITAEEGIIFHGSDEDAWKKLGDLAFEGRSGIHIESCAELSIGTLSVVEGMDKGRCMHFAWAFDPVSSARGQVLRFMYDTGADIGQIFDGDAQALGVVPSEYRKINGPGGTTMWMPMCYLSFAVCDRNGRVIQNPYTCVHNVPMMVSPGVPSKNRSRLQSAYLLRNFYTASSPTGN